MAPHLPQALTKSFTAVDTYISNSLVLQDASLTRTLQANTSASLASIDIAPNQGKLLYLLAKMNYVSRYLEIGTLGGFSAIWVAKALPSPATGGKIITLEIDPLHAEVSTSNFSRAGFADLVEVKVRPAMETWRRWKRKAPRNRSIWCSLTRDKQNNVGYFLYAPRFARRGTLIVVDNVARGGRVVDDGGEADAAVLGVRRLFEEMGRQGRVECTAVQTVGCKGWDGFAVALVVE